MRVVPEGTRLVRSRELVKERVSRNDRALSDARRSICPSTPGLEETVPVLSPSVRKRQGLGLVPETYNTCQDVHRCIGQGVNNIQIEGGPLQHGEWWKHEV